MNARAPIQPQTPIELLFTVTATFTAEPIGEVLRFWLSRPGLGPARVEFAGDNQVFQELVAPDSRMASAQAGVNFLRARLEDWSRDQADDLKAEAIATNTREFVRALSAFARRARRPTLLFLCPPSDRALQQPEIARVLAAMEEEVRSAAVGLRGVSVLTSRDLATLYPVEVVDDPESDRQGHIPFTRPCWAALGTLLVRQARSLLQ